MHPAPSSWALEGDSSSRIAAKTTEQSGWNVSITELSAAGSLGSVIVISSQPKTCELSASAISHARCGRPGPQVEVARDDTPEPAADRRSQRRVVERPRGAPEVAAALAERQQEAGVRDSGQYPEQRPERGVDAVGAVLEHARDQDHPDADDRDRGESGPWRPLPEHGPREERDEDDLGVPEHGRKARSHLLDRVVPEDQVGGEEGARDPREPPGAPLARPVAPILEPGKEPEHRQRPDAPEEGAGRRRTLA